MRSWRSTCCERLVQWLAPAVGVGDEDLLICQTRHQVILEMVGNRHGPDADRPIETDERFWLGSGARCQNEIPGRDRPARSGPSSRP